MPQLQFLPPANSSKLAQPWRRGSTGPRLVIVLCAVLVVIVTLLLGLRWLVIRHAQSVIAQRLDNPVVYVGSLLLEGGIGLGFHQQFEYLGRFEMVTYYYRLPGGDIFMRIGDSSLLLRYNPQ
ncbi:MAG: hypothetical protein EA402_03555 [Planctomycetota bacterium]|nr:MAG: hypothetical protein EA402_03555 [Planctomycetota bacterium]